MFRNRRVPTCVDACEHECLVRPCPHDCGACDDNCSAWRELAKRMREHNIVPSRYVRWAYHAFRQRKYIPWITQITSPATVDRYREVEQAYIEAELLKLQLQVAMLQHALQDGRRLEEIVDDDLLDLDDAVRYVVARKAGMTDRAERLRHWADLDLENEPVFKSVLASFLG